MTLQTLTNLTAALVGDQNATRYAGKYTEALNLAQQQFSFETKCYWKDASTITVVSGTSGYSLPSDFWLEKKVTHKGLELDPISRKTLETDYQGSGTDWTTITGTPKYYIIDPEEARKQITLFPQPTGNDAGANLVLTYYAVPADMAAQTDQPFGSYALLVPYHIAVALWAAWLLLGYEKADPLILTKRDRFFQQYQDKVSQCVDNFKNTASEPLRLRGSR